LIACDMREDNPLEVVVYCPQCALREFGPVDRSRQSPGLPASLGDDASRTHLDWLFQLHQARRYRGFGPWQAGSGRMHRGERE